VTSYHRQRGGSWLDNAHLVRCATRNTLDSDEDDAVCGFRPVAEGEEVPEEEGNRMLRGGSWYYVALSVRCAIRCSVDPELSDARYGFRPVAEEMYRILRGGSKFARRGTCRCACRFRFDPSDRHVALYGFRPVADPPTSR
jgi:formylglycine-generating enzyme required for sulfatase activity